MGRGIPGKGAYLSGVAAMGRQRSRRALVHGRVSPAVGRIGTSVVSGIRRTDVSAPRRNRRSAASVQPPISRIGTTAVGRNSETPGGISLPATATAERTPLRGPWAVRVRRLPRGLDPASNRADSAGDLYRFRPASYGRPTVDDLRSGRTGPALPPRFE